MSVGWGIPDPIAGGFWLENPSRSGGAAQNGQEQVVVSMAMRQRAQWTVPIRNASNVMRARRFLAYAAGRAGSILVPIFEPKKGRVAVVDDSVLARATDISINLYDGPVPEEGRHFGIADRVYLIRDVTGSGPYTLYFYPPLREDAAADTPVLFDEAVCEMRLVNDQTPILLDVMRFAMLELEFVEYF